MHHKILNSASVYTSSVYDGAQNTRLSANPQEMQCLS